MTNLSEQTIEDVLTDFYMRQYHAVWGIQSGFRTTDNIDTVETKDGEMDAYPDAVLLRPVVTFMPFYARGIWTW